MRVPCVVRWPGKVAAGSECVELATTMDLLPTFAKLAEAAMPKRKIDGHDIRALLFGEKGAHSPYDAFYYYHLGQLHAVRSGKWKLHLGIAKKSVSLGGNRKAFEARLYDVGSDVGETRNVAAGHADVVKMLNGYAERARAELGDDDRKGSGQRAAGFVDQPRAQVKR